VSKVVLRIKKNRHSIQAGAERRREMEPSYLSATQTVFNRLIQIQPIRVCIPVGFQIVFYFSSDKLNAITQIKAGFHRAPALRSGLDGMTVLGQ
jgi:hypothetical protein